MSGVWRLVRDGSLDPVANMARDAALFHAGEVPTLRLYRWRPESLSLGCFQSPEAAEAAAARRAGVPVVRRLTGGGAIVHGDEVTWSLTLPPAFRNHPVVRGPVPESYRRLNTVLLEALARVGARLTPPPAGAPAPCRRAELPFFCFARASVTDLVGKSGKIAGSAQRRSAGRFLQHGSIVLRPPSFGPPAGSLEAELGAAPPPDALEQALAEAFADVAGTPLREEPLRPAELATAERLAAAVTVA